MYQKRLGRMQHQKDYNSWSGGGVARDYGVGLTSMGRCLHFNGCLEPFVRIRCCLCLFRCETEVFYRRLNEDLRPTKRGSSSTRSLSLTSLLKLHASQTIFKESCEPEGDSGNI